MLAQTRQALAHLEAKHPETAIELLLAAWREDRSDALAELLERLSPRVRIDERAVRAAWKRAEAPATRDVPLLAAFFSFAGTAAAVKALGLMRTWPDDPRLLRALARSLGEKRHSGIDAEDQLLEPAVDLLIRARDRGAAALLREAARRRRGSLFGALLREQATRLETQVPERADRWAAEVVHFRPSFAVSPPTPAAAPEAWRLHLEAPLDDDRRAVLADALEAVGDPRGEFIALQRQHEPSHPRARALLKKHYKAWLGPVAKSTRLSDVTFVRGFLDRVVLSGFAPLTALVNAPALATVRSLEVSSARPAPEFVALATSLRGLEHVSLTTREQARLLVAQGWPSQITSATVATSQAEAIDTADLCAQSGQVRALWFRTELPWKSLSARRALFNAFQSVRWTDAPDPPRCALRALALASQLKPEVEAGYEDDAIVALRRGSTVSISCRSPMDLLRILRELEADGDERIVITAPTGALKPSVDVAEDLVRAASRFGPRLEWARGPSR